MSKNACSLKVIKDGKRLYGTAAMLHMTSKAGGFDKWLKDYSQKVAEKAVEEAFSELITEEQRPALKIV